MPRDAAAVSADTLRPGQQLGAYRIRELLAEGSAARTFAAEHAMSGRRVALKVLRDELSRSSSAIGRFLAEARAAGQIRHPNVVEVIDIVEDHPGRHFYYATELVSGTDLGAALERGAPLPLSRTLALAVQLAETLEVIHAKGLAHRDLKPSSVLITERNGRRDLVVLSPFGVARVTAPEWRDGGWVSRPAGDPIQTVPLYMAPEQAGEAAIDARSDMWSFGAVLFHMVTGRPPYPAATLRDLLVQLGWGDPPAPSRVDGLPHLIPPSLDALIASCLSADPLARPRARHAAAVLRDTEARYWTQREIVAELPESDDSIDVDLELEESEPTQPMYPHAGAPL